jgi:uncharacterized membrane protein SpoIIM required for sporulation
MLRERSFVEARENRWRSLEELLTLVERHGITRIGPERIEDIGRLYRAVTSDLAAAQSRDYDPEIREYLNRLTARAHAVVYAERDMGSWARIVNFYARSFPREVRRSWRPITACASVFVAAIVFSYLLVMQRPLDVYALLPDSSIPLITKSLHDSNFAVDPVNSPALSTFIITNNIQVSAIAFAGGMTLGILTLWIILNNGLMVGGLGALFTQKGFGPDWWATISPHGVFELTAIQISGGAGLLLALAVIAPGRLRRVDALRANARRAGTLIVGVASMLVIAGTIEGFFTPLRTPLWARALVGMVTAAILIAYFGLAGRDEPPEALSIKEFAT